MQKLNQTRDLMEGVENIAFKAQNGIINKCRDSLQCKSLLADSKGDKEVIFISSPKCQEEVSHNVISDSTTVSSKLLSSASPPNQRSQIENNSTWQMTPNRRSKNSSLMSGSSQIYDEEKKEKSKCGTKRKKRSYESIIKAKAVREEYNTGRWTRLEHFKFLEALKIFGKEWQKVQQHVNTRTSTQARSHAQKFFVKLEKFMTLDEYLESLDLEELKIKLKIGEGGDLTEYDEDQLLIMTNSQRKIESVMNIALPSASYQQISSPNQKIKSNTQYQNNEIIDVDQEDIACEKEIQNSKRSCIQRKAKTNHAFFSNNYSTDIKNSKENSKRRKIGYNEEIIIKSGSDTKICINNYALQRYHEDHRDAQEIEELQQFEKEMQDDSDIEEICDNPRAMIKDISNREYGYYHNSVLDNHQESIDEIINEKHKIDDFKGFNIIPHLSQIDSNINLNSHMNDFLKAESLNFNESKTIKADEKIKIDTVDECNLFKIPNHSISLIDNFDG